MDELEQFAKRFLTGRINWSAIDRKNGVINFGNIVSLCLYRKPPFQVELFIGPLDKSSFTEHKHPDVDVIEFALSGEAMLFINSASAHTEADVQQWVKGDVQTLPVRIKPSDWHSGFANTPWAFLSIQHWLNNVQPTSVGLNWIGEPFSVEQSEMWNEPEHQMLA